MHRVFFLVIIPLLMLLSCNISNPPSSNSSINLSVEDAACTEAWIRIKTSNVSLPDNIVILKNNQIMETIRLVNSDTLIHVDSLQPNKNYNFECKWNFISGKVSVQTLDTTSHNITWQKLEFGSGSLLDVAIINENDIWAVGSIYLTDSTGFTDPEIYNAVHWDGENWTVTRISTLFKNGQIGPTPLNGIMAFSSTDIWVSDGTPIHGDGKNWTGYQLWDMGILGPKDGHSLCLWGNSSKDIYFGGTLGTVVHYDGYDWKKIENGTTLDINGIYGAKNETTNADQILAVASRNYPLSTAILQINPNSVSEISKYPLIYELFGLWFSPEKKYYVVGIGVYEKKSLSESGWKNDTLCITKHSIMKAQATGLNDVFMVGSFGEILHFNGISWKSYLNEGTGIIGSYTSVAIKNNLIVVVGGGDDGAIIQIGRR